jgi:hypothetical protein
LYDVGEADDGSGKRVRDGAGHSRATSRRATRSLVSLSSPVTVEI